MKISILLLQIIFVFGLSAAMGQSYDELVKLDGYDLPVYVSKGHEDIGHKTAGLTDKAIQYMAENVAGFTPEVTLLVLSPNDWATYANMPIIYGMPHIRQKNILVVSAADNPFWRSFMPAVEIVPTYLRELYLSTYMTNTGELSGRAFFDLVAIHELGHAFYEQAGIRNQAYWLSELFANILLHTFIAEMEPSHLPGLEILPQAVISMGAEDYEYTTLEQFEASYVTIARTAPKNYGWYQLGLNITAKKIYDTGGLEALQSLWDALKNEKEKIRSEELLIMLQNKTHPSIAQMVENWNN